MWNKSNNCWHLRDNLCPTEWMNRDDLHMKPTTWTFSSNSTNLPLRWVPDTEAEPQRAVCLESRDNQSGMHSQASALDHFSLPCLKPTWAKEQSDLVPPHFHALEKEMATHSSVLAWRIPGTGEPGGLPSMGSHRHDWSDLAAAAAALSFWLGISIELLLVV